MHTEKNSTWTTFLKHAYIFWASAKIALCRNCTWRVLCHVFSFPGNLYKLRLHKRRHKQWVNIFIEFQPGL